MKGLEDTARKFTELLDRLNIEYAMMGGMAVRLYGLPRATFDVDFTALLPRNRLAELAQEAEELGFSVPAAQQAGWIDQVRGMPVIKFQWTGGVRGIDVDIFLAETPYQRELLARRVQLPVDGWQACLSPPKTSSFSSSLQRAKRTWPISRTFCWCKEHSTTSISSIGRHNLE